MSQSLRTKNCNIHPNVKASFFCLDHQCNKKGPICDKCATQIHQEHESIFTIEDISDFLEDQVQENIKCAEKEDQHFDEIHSSITEKLDQIYTHINQFENYVITKMDFLKQKIKKEKKLLKEKLDDIFEFRELFKNNNSDMIVNVLQGIDATQMQNQIRKKSKSVVECKKFLNPNNQKLHIKDFRVSEPSFLKSLILKKFAIQMKKISNHCVTLLDKIYEETICQFQQKNLFQFKKMPNKYLEEKYLDSEQKLQKRYSLNLKHENSLSKSKSQDKDYDSSSSVSSQIDQFDFQGSGKQIPSLSDILKQIEVTNGGDDFSAYNTFLVDKRIIGDKIEVTNDDRVLEQKGFVQRYAFLFPQFKEIDDHKKLYHAKIRILNYRSWIALGIANRDAIQKQNFKYIEGQKSSLLSLNGFVYNNGEEAIKEYEKFDINQGDIISLLFYFTSPCKTESCLEIWLNNTQMLKTFKGQLFEKHDLEHMAFCIGLLKGDSVEILRD